MESCQVQPANAPMKTLPPVILVDETDTNYHKFEVEVDADGFIKVDRNRRSRSRSTDNREQTKVSEKRETRDSSENRFDALTSTLKPDEVETSQNPSDDENVSKKHIRKSRSSKSKEKEIKPKLEPSKPLEKGTTDEDKRLTKKDKKKLSSKSKDKVPKSLEMIPCSSKIDSTDASQTKKPTESPPITKPETKKNNKKKKKDKKSVEIIQTTESTPTAEVINSELQSKPSIVTHLDTPLSTPESSETPLKERVFSEAQYWRTDLSCLDLSEIISVEIQHAPTFSSSETKTIKLEIKDDNSSRKDILISPSNVTRSVNEIPSASQFITQEILAMNVKAQELEAKIIEDQSLESKMADLQKEIEEMLLPENDSSIMSDDSPKELTDTQNSIDYQYDELLDNMSPSLATPEPDSYDPVLVETTSACYNLQHDLDKHGNELDGKHVSMSMIDSLLDDTEPMSMTDTLSLEHTEDLLQVTQEEQTPRDFEKQDLSVSISENVVTVPEEATESILKFDVETTTTSTLDYQEIIDVNDFDKAKEIENPVMYAEKDITNPIATVTTSLSENLQDLIQRDDGSDDVRDKTSKLHENETMKTDPMSIIPEPNIEIITNTLANLKADTFWVDKHIVDDAEKLLSERNSLEKDITFKTYLDDLPTKDETSVYVNIVNDNSFWPEKHLYHDAERQYFLLLASQLKTPATESSEINIKEDEDKDRGQGGSSGHSSEADEPKDASGSPYNSSYISMDLPGGMCSWRDKSSYLSPETPLNTDERNEPTLREDVLTTPTKEPAPSSSIQDPTTAPPRTTKDELSNDIETLLEEIKDVQTRLSDLPDESLDAMEEGLREGITILVKCEEAATILKSKVMESQSEQEVQSLLKELLSMKGRILKLLKQARDGLHIIQVSKDAKVEMSRRTKEVEEQKQQLVKLDTWLEAINVGLRETTVQSEIVVEEDIIRCIEIYERYIREYEEYEMILKSITVINDDESSQSLRTKLNAMQKALEETKHLVIIEIERLRQVLMHLRSAPEVAEDDISQTDRTIDSTSMPEEIVSPREVVPAKEITDVVEEITNENKITINVPSAEDSIDKVLTVQESKPSHGKPAEIRIVKETVAIETQTGKSLMSEPPSVSDKSIICQPDVIETYDKSITCLPPQEVEVQTSEPHSTEKDILQSIQIKQTISDGHETIEIATRPVHSDQKLDEQSLLVGADYRDDMNRKDSQLNIIHSLPQSFETVMVEPDETTTEVVVDADGTKRIIVKKIRKTLVTRQQVIEGQQHESHILSSNKSYDQAYSKIALAQNEGATSSMLEDGGVRHIQYQTSEGQIISNLPGGEFTVQEYVSKPETFITMDKDMKPEDILQLVEAGVPAQIQTSSSSVTAVVQQVTKRIIRTRRRIIRRIVIIDGKEHVTEEVIEEPDDVEVFEEQIPRVSISVNQKGSVPIATDGDDGSDKDNHPPGPFLTKDFTHDETTNKEKPEVKSRDEPADLQDQNQPMNITDSTRTQEMVNLMHEFMKKESESQSIPVIISRETSPLKTVTIVESSETLPEHEETRFEPESISYVIQEPSENIKVATEWLPGENQTVITSEGALQSTFETSSTVVQRVVRKITRTRKRIIRHITIIDGKEHVTEEVIEEPDDVEIVEEEPQIAHTQNVNTKRIKILRKVEIIDGKEHVTEQIVEEPDEDVIDESQLIESKDVTDLDTTSSEKPEVVDVVGSKFIKEIDTVYSSDPIASVKSDRKVDKPDIVELKRDIISLDSPESTTGIFKEDQTNPSIKDLDEKEIIDDQPYSSKTLRIVKHVIIKDGKEHVAEEVVEEPFEIGSEEFTTIPHGVTTDTVQTKRIKIIKHIQVINGKEHVTEQIVEEPEEDIVTDSLPSHNLQTEGHQIKRVKIIKRLVIKDGAEHATEEIVEEPEREFLSDSTVTAQIDLKLNQYPSVSSTVDITKSFIGSESTHPAISTQENKLPVHSDIVASDLDQSNVSYKPDDDFESHDNQGMTDIITQFISSETEITDKQKILKTKELPLKTDEISTVEEKLVSDIPDESKNTQIITSVEKDGENSVLVTTSTTNKTIFTTDIVDKPEIQTVYNTNPAKTEVTLQKIQQSIQTTDPEVKALESTDISKNIEEKPDVTVSVFAEISRKDEQVETGYDVIHKSFVESEKDHTVMSITPASPVKSKSEEQLITEVDVLKRPQEKETSGYTKIPQQVIESNIPETSENETAAIIVRETIQYEPELKQPQEKETSEYTKIPQQVIESNIPETLENETAPIIVRETTQYEPQLEDIIIKPDIESKVTEKPIEIFSKEIHTQVDESKTSPEIIEDKSKKPESFEKDTSKSPESPGLNTETIMSPSQAVQSATEILPQTMALEVIESTETSSEPTDHTLIDVMKKFIGSEIDHTKPDTSFATVQNVTESVLVKGSENLEPQITVSEKIDKDYPKQFEGIEIVKELSIPTESKEISHVDVTKTFIGSEIDHSTISKIPVKPIKNDSYNLQTEGIKTKGFKIIKRIQIIDGKEYVTEEVVEETNDDFVPDSTITAQIDLTLQKPSDDVTVSQFISEKLPAITEQPIDQLSASDKDTYVTEITVSSTELEGSAQLPQKEIKTNVTSDVDVKNIETTIEDVTISSTELKDAIPPVEDSQSIVLEEKVREEISPSKRKITEKEEPVANIAYEDETDTAMQLKPEVILENKQPTTEFPFLHSDASFNEPQFGVIELTKELIIQEGTGQFEPIPEPGHESADARISYQFQEITKTRPTQSTTTVEPLVVTKLPDLAIAETHITSAPTNIEQLNPKVIESKDNDKKLLGMLDKPEQQDVKLQTIEVSDSSKSGLPKPVPKYDITMLLHSERQDTDLRTPKLEPSTSQVDKNQRTIDISMSLTEQRESQKVAPKVQFDLKVQEFEAEPVVIKKDIEVILPSEIKVTKETPKAPALEEITEQPKETITPESGEKHKKSKKKKKPKTGSTAGDSTEVDTDKSIAETDSSSLSHYVELPTSPKVESPKPTEDILQTPIEREEVPEQIIDSYVESENVSVSEERGYEPEDLSIGPEQTLDKKKKPKKRRQHGVSEDTTYPNLTTTETENSPVATPVEPIKKGKDKRRKKKGHTETTVQPDVTEPEPKVGTDSNIDDSKETEHESPNVGTEIVASPKEESYHTISETSDISAVKIVEECVQSSPEVAEKEIPTTITFPVQVVEEIATQEDSIQTSPKEMEPSEEVTRPETCDIELQTTPTSISEVITQTVLVEDKEAHTQTIEEVPTIPIMSDTEMQTSRSESPVKIIQSEATTQVIPHDIVAPSEMYSQTSPVIEEPIIVEEKPMSPDVVQESREIQTSPEPEIQTDDKSTEILVQTTETDIQTIKQDITEQGTSTTPIKEKELTEMSIQTPEVHLVSTFTQSDTPEPIVEQVQLTEEIKTPSLPPLDIKQEIITVDSTQQTTPREENVSPKLDIKEVVTVCTSQQTTPREPEAVIEIQSTVAEKSKSPSPEPTPLLPKQQVTVDRTQQTSPRADQISESSRVDIPTLDLQREIITIDSVQQTTPRGMSDDSTSTSTSEPYEIHLKARVTIPQATTDFLDNERQFEEPPLSNEKHKSRKRKSKKKTESPQTPESLSDPINSELSVSITPTSEDISLRDASSIDEGISYLESPSMITKPITHPKMTYSDAVQRSKSKSPSPSKTIIPQKSEKARLIVALEKRTQSVTESPKPDDSLIIALVDPSVENSYQLVVNKELDEIKNAIENNDLIRTEKSVIIIVETISIWLEEIQYKIQRQTIAGVRPTQETERLKELQRDILKLKHIIEVTEVNEEIITMIETLTRQVDAVNTLNNQSFIKLQEYETEWIRFLDDTDKVSNSVEAVKEVLDNIILSEIPSQQKLEQLDKIESTNLDNAETIRKMFKRCRSLIEANPKRVCPSKLYDCDDDTKQVDNAVNMERDRLLQLTSLAEEYEQTLQDFGQITDVAEALLDGKIIVTDLEHLHEEIQKHRKFFVNLSHCRAILESLEDNLDSETRAKFSALHNLLHDRATVIIDRAASRAQQMTLAASRWSLLKLGMKEELQWLVVAQQRVPDLSSVTSVDHEQYINLYQSISLDLSHHHAKMLRLLSITDGLQNLIVCSGLDTECSVALESLQKLQEDVDSRLTRLTAFKENWVTYDYLIDRIEGWMKVANRELEFITPENITTTGNLRRFWELKAQHEVYNNLKNESGVQFEKALEILPLSDEPIQREFFSKFVNTWNELHSKISDIHSTAIQNISDRDVSSGEKLNILEEELRELRTAVEGLKGVIKSIDELNLYIERLQVMTSRIDRIQNELGRLSLLPTAESERLGALLSQSGILEDQIAEELERSMLLKEKIVQVQTGIARCQKSQRRAKLTLEECESAERLGSDVVERASENCDKLIDELGVQWRDILALRQALHTLPTSLKVVVSPTGVEKDISGLQETHAELEAACSDLSSRLRTKLQLWRRFERQLEMVHGAVREADYMAELLTVQGQVDYDRLLKATEKLETLSESLTRRSGELVGELRATSAPLLATAEPTVAAALRRDLDSAEAAYEHTCANLTHLCDKYNKAVDLWKRYRDAAAAVRSFADSAESRVHALRPDDAPAMKQACLEQEARVVELRSLAARVAAETGSRALPADADALARRLQLVTGAVQALADLGEARQLARAKAQHAKDQLCDMRLDLAPVHEDSEIVEDKLIALRDNLIALGKSEADIAPAKAELPDIDRDVADEHSIVRILELWQAMFRDTFFHYHRLSTALIRSGDAATALKLWHEYLIDLQSFLSGSVPADYENLTEHRRLCRVHKNLLTSQRSVLMNENRETSNRDLADKFDTLTNLHNETLARIVERHDEVCTRIAAWDDYREVYTELLRWLKEMEREKEKLQLRYVHIKRIHKILDKIQNLSDKVPEGKRQSDKLFVDLKKVLQFTDEAYGASVRMEYAGMAKRVENLQASLDTWRDFLTRILGLINEYESMSNDLLKLYSKTQDEIMSYSDEDKLSRPQLKKAVEKYTDLRTKIVKTESQIETLSVIQEQLKECLSPQDIRLVNQRVWQLRQQRSDLEHQLSIIIHRLQERIEVYIIFESRLTRFVEWITTLESRLESSTQSTEIGAIDPQDLIRRINSEIQAETALKEREFEWLAETGTSLIDQSKKDEKSFSKNSSKHLKDVQERWHKLQETGKSRIAKINHLLEMITKLEERLAEIRIRLHAIESNLSASVVLESLSVKAVDEKFIERDAIQTNIDKESKDVAETLNRCEIVFNDPDVLRGNFDIRNLHTGVDIVDKKWKNIRYMSERRKNALKDIRKSAEQSVSLLPKVEKKLENIERRVEKIETRKRRCEPEDQSVCQAVADDLEKLSSDVKRLEDAYSRIAASRGIELRGTAADDAARLRNAVRYWQRLSARLAAVGADAHQQFVGAHGAAVVALAETDVRLTRALHLSPAPQDKLLTLNELDAIEQELMECQVLVDTADRLAVAVSAVPGVPDMVAEYRALYADVRTRLDLARAEVVGDVDSAVQVDTLKWETDAALQVDTLTSKETYRVELVTAVKQTSEALDALRIALETQPDEKAGSEALATAAKEIARAGTKPGQTLELAKHLSELLMTECDANEDEAMLKDVESLSLTYEDLLNQAKKRELQINNLRLPHSALYALTCEHESGRLTCPLCSERNWKQLDNDLWRLEQWLQFAEATDEARTGPPEMYDALEDVIQDHREFLLDLDSHKSIVVSLNVVGSHVAAHARSPPDADRVRARLARANARWDTACERAAVWQRTLQHALLHNKQFHDATVELVARLASAERAVRAREPLRLGRDPSELQHDFRRFTELRDELRRAEPRVLALHEAAALLAPGAGPHARLAELRLRLQSLRKLCAVYALKLGAALARRPAASTHTHVLAAAAALAAPQLMEEEDDDELARLQLPPLDETEMAGSSEAEEEQLSRVQRGLRFVCRVARASLPFQALLLLLLGAAALAPHGRSSDCNNRPLSLQPVLQYPHGPPPI